MGDFVKWVCYFCKKKQKNQGEKYKNSLGTFVKGTYEKRKTCKININPGSDGSGEFWDRKSEEPYINQEYTTVSKNARTWECLKLMWQLLLLLLWQLLANHILHYLLF